MDNGDIFWQGDFSIGPGDTIADLIAKTIPLYRYGATAFLRGELPEATPQDEGEATYSIWRNEEDYRINWQEEAAVIERSVRALGPPYPGAYTTLRGQRVVIHCAETVPDLNFAIRQPGKVFRLDDAGLPVVVCGKGLLRIRVATVEGESLLPFRSLRVRFC